MSDAVLSSPTPPENPSTWFDDLVKAVGTSTQKAIDEAKKNPTPDLPDDDFIVTPEEAKAWEGYFDDEL